MLRSDIYLKKQEPEMAKKPFSFAHLLGRGASASEEEEDKKSKSRKAEEDEREDDADDDDKKDDKRDDGAEDDIDDADASEDDDDSDDDGDDRKESKGAKSARIAERKRCARIFGSQHAAANPALAASLAFNTGMSSTAAIDVLASTAPASPAQSSRKRSLDQRMQENHDIRLGQDADKSVGKSTLASKMTTLYNSTKGDK